VAVVRIDGDRLFGEIKGQAQSLVGQR